MRQEAPPHTVLIKRSLLKTISKIMYEETTKKALGMNRCEEVTATDSHNCNRSIFDVITRIQRSRSKSFASQCSCHPPEGVTKFIKIKRKTKYSTEQNVGYSVTFTRGDLFENIRREYTALENRKHRVQRMNTFSFASEQILFCFGKQESISIKLKLTSV